MIYSEFITTTSNYLKSVRILKDYVTFDMTFPSSWLLPKKGPAEIEILQNSDKDGSIITSFVCQNKTKLIDVIENTIQNVIKTNYKQELYSQLKSLDKSQVRNTIHEEQKYSLWNRIITVLGMK